MTVVKEPKTKDRLVVEMRLAQMEEGRAQSIQPIATVLFKAPPVQGVYSDEELAVLNTHRPEPSQVVAHDSVTDIPVAAR